MSSLPSLSQSNTPTPPLMDSMTYRLSIDEMWGTVSPARAPMSSKIGTGANASAETAVWDFDWLRVRGECWTSLFSDWAQTTAKGIYKVNKQRTRVPARSIGGIVNGRALLPTFEVPSRAETSPA